MDNGLAGKTLIVTGAAGGVGRAVVAKALAEGAKVVASDIAEGVSELENMAKNDIATIAADASDEAEVERMFGLAESRFGSVDVIVSNAGFIISKSVHETSVAEWDQVLDVNAKSLFLLARRGLPGMMERKSGSIVATGSISSIVGLPEQAAYCAAKGALLQLVRQMAVDYADRGIRVNAVGAGSINTPFLTRYLDGMEDSEAAKADIRAAHPLGRWAEPDEIADSIIYLAGSAASFVTGHILMADGGYSAR